MNTDLPSFKLHTSELGDGYDWNRINLKSVTDENTLDEFLATAELAGTEFTAGKALIRCDHQSSSQFQKS